MTITRLEQNTFFALLTLIDDSAAVEIDARPSDAIALSLRASAPIYATEQVLEEAAMSASQMREEAEEIQKFKDLMSEINLPDYLQDRDIPPGKDEDTEDEE